MTLSYYDIYSSVGEELYCPHCKKKEFGVKEAIFNLAKYYAEQFQFNYFYNMEETASNFQLNVGKVADMMSWLLNNDGLKDRYAYFENKRKNN